MGKRYTFGRFELDAQERRLTRGEAPLRIEPKSFDVLVYLLEHAGTLVRKQTLVDAVWNGAEVTDNALTRCVHQIRAALDDDADSPEFVETVPRSGYRFIAPLNSTGHPTVTKPATDRRTASMRLAAATSLLAILLVAGFWLISRTWLDPGPGIFRVAVLPLANLTGDSGQRYFVQGIHEAVITELSRIPEINVISRTSVTRYQNTEMSIPEIAQQLDVDVIVEGSVSRTGDNLTVTAQLVAVAPERNLWARRFHRSVADAFEITTEIARSVAAEIAVSFGGTARAFGTAAPRLDPDAYDAYLRGRFAFDQRLYEQAQSYFQRAIDLDPEFALAYAGLADTIGSAIIFGLYEPAAKMPLVEELAETALRLDSTLAEAHRVRAAVDFYWHWDLDAAERSIRRALALNPSFSDSYRILAQILTAAGRHAAAVEAIERSRELDPLSLAAQVVPSLIFYLKRDYQAAIDNARNALEMAPQFWRGHWMLCLSLAAANELRAAIQACETAVAHSDRTPVALGALGYVYAVAGKRHDAEQISEELRALSERTYISPWLIAAIEGALGNMDHALETLERGLENRDPLLVYIDAFEIFDSLRAHPKFDALLR